MTERELKQLVKLLRKLRTVKNPDGSEANTIIEQRIVSCVVDMARWHGEELGLDIK